MRFYENGGLYIRKEKLRLIRSEDVSAAITIIVIFVLTGSFCIHSLFRELRLHSEQNRLLEMCQNSISKLDYIENDAALELAAMNRSSRFRCSQENLNALRKRVFKNKGIEDAGWFQSDKILCSALVAPNFDGASNLKLIAKPENNTALYQSGFHFSIQNKPTLIARMGNAYVNIGLFGLESATPSQLESFTTIRDVRGYYVTIPGAGWNSTSLPNPQAPWIFTTPGKYRHKGRIYATACTAQNKACATASESINFFLAREYVSSIVAFVCGGLLGGLLGGAFLLLYIRRKSLESQLHRAIRKNRLYMEYQPIVRIADGRIVGAEALCRWKNEDGLQVSPQKFIQIAEQKQWIGDLTKRTFSMAFDECGELLRQNPTFKLSVNLSPYCFENPEFIEELRKLPFEHGVKPESVDIEITESATAHDPEIIAHIDILRAMGHSINLDDFGTGYSSLSYLHELRIDTIKIDRAFIWGIGINSVHVDILPQILSIAKKLNFAVVVEGIETPEQEAYLAGISDSLLGQGWLYGKSVSCNQLLAMLDTQPKTALHLM
jgi:sensor c-di-GMP phosphodiesterase-like protein